MYDYHIFFMVITFLAGVAFGIAALCSVNAPYKPQPVKNNRIAYEKAAPKELELP